MSVITEKGVPIEPVQKTAELRYCPGCGKPKRWTWHLAHCILNGVVLSDEDLRILADAAIWAEEANCALRRELHELRDKIAEVAA